MLTGVITHPQQDLAKMLKTEGVEALEFRLDFIEKLTSIPTLPTHMTTIFTLRKKEHLSLLHLRPTYVDLPWDIDQEIIDTVRCKHPKVKIILSYHNFKETPKHLGALLEKIRGRQEDMIKLACYAKSSLDSMRMLQLINSERKKGTPIAGTCMGELGQITRILGKAIGSVFTYAPLEGSRETAPGQLPIETLIFLYRFNQLGPKTPIYGLIGDPVKQSIGHLCHNAIFKALGEDAVYVKIALKKGELSSFFKLIEPLQFQGFSVTMPLKESVQDFAKASPHAKTIGAINTLKRTVTGWIGENTDADGAMDAIEERFPVKQTKVAVLGTGGAARALCFGAKWRGASVGVFSRTHEKGKVLAALIKGKNLDASDLKQCDLILNATPSSMPIALDLVNPKTTVFDINYNPIDTPFLQTAKDKGCAVIYGFEMFRHQALKQLEIWLERPLAKKAFDKAFFLRFLNSNGGDQPDALNSDSKSLSLSHQS